MLKTIFKIGAISLQLVKFDTQDNLVKTCEATEWSQVLLKQNLKI